MGLNCSSNDSKINGPKFLKIQAELLNSEVESLKERTWESSIKHVGFLTDKKKPLFVPLTSSTFPSSVWSSLFDNISGNLHNFKDKLIWEFSRLFWFRLHYKTKVLEVRCPESEVQDRKWSFVIFMDGFFFFTYFVLHIKRIPESSTYNILFFPTLQWNIPFWCSISSIFDKCSLLEHPICCQTIYPSQKFTSMNLLQMPCKIT